MSKQLKSIIIAAAALVIIVAAIIAVKSIPSKEKADEIKDNLIDVVSKNVEDVSMVQVENSKGSYTITKSEDGKSYVLNSDDSLPAEQNYLATAFSSLSHQYASKIAASDLGKLADFGLVNAVSVKLSTKDGEIKYYVGAAAPVGDGSYCYVEGKNEVYLLSSTPNYAVQYSSNEFIKTSVAPDISNDTFNKLTEFSLSGTGREGSMKARLKNEEDKKTTGVIATYLQTEPFAVDLLADKISDKLTGPFAEMKPTVAAVIKPSEDDLARCGLKNPFYRLSFAYDGKNYGFSVGSVNPDGFRYFSADGTDVIYLIDEAQVKFMGVSSMELIDRTIYIKYIDAFDRITVNNGSDEYIYALSGDKDNLVVKSDGKTLNTDDFKQLYQLMIGTFAQGEVKKPAGAPVYATITFNKRDGGSDVLKFYSMDERKMYMELNGVTHYYCTKEDVDAIFTQIDKMK